jgi:hypothetical protein
MRNSWLSFGDKKCSLETISQLCGVLSCVCVTEVRQFVIIAEGLCKRILGFIGKRPL